MADHKDKGILQISYNILNLPNYIKFSDYVGTRFKRYVTSSFIYRADGTKLNKIYNYKDPNSVASLISTETDYLDGFQYEASTTVSNPIPSYMLKFVPTSEGYYNFENNKYIYSYTDHLGNVRLSYTKNGSGTEIIEENNFYPFGMKHEGYNQTTGNPSYNYGYGGKELQKETGWSDFGARMYMSDIGRWGVIDPLAETSRRFNPYNYAYNNPVMFIDPDGRKAKVVNQDDYTPGFLRTGSPMDDLARGGVVSMDELMRKLEQMEKDADVGGGSGPTPKNSTGPGLVGILVNFWCKLFGGSKKNNGTIKISRTGIAGTFTVGTLAYEGYATGTAGTAVAGTAFTGALTLGGILIPRDDWRT